MKEGCQKCGIREATEDWCDGGAIGFIHGMGQRWCQWCVVVAQLEHARAMAARVAELEAQLARLS